MKSFLCLSIVAIGATIASAQTGDITFTKHVAPILQNKCQMCHRAESFAPMSLLTYEEVRPWAKSIKEKVVTRTMPPWYIDRNVGVEHFKNDASLTDAEITTIAKWVDAGAPKGNAADMPAPRKFEDQDKWHIGEPDLIINLPEDRVVLAKSPDKWLDIIVDPQLKEDRYIQAIETKPTKGYKVVHHAVTRMHHDEDGDDGGNTEAWTFLNEYAVGKNGDVFPEGSGRLMKAGTKVNFNMHLHSIGQETPANIALAIKFYPKGYKPKFIETTEAVGSTKDLDIPPNTDNVRADGYTQLTKPARIRSFQPHLHNRGKAQCLEAIYPGGKKVETLSCVSNYQFAWHLVYLYADDEQPLLPAGTLLHTISWYNNTSSNKFNPDPDNLITYGQRTIDEMSHTWVNWSYLSDDEYKTQLAEREAKQKKTLASASGK